MEPQPAVRQFVAFGPSNLAVIAVFIVVAAALVTAGRRCRGTPAQRWLSWTLALVFAVFLVSVEIYWLLPWQAASKYSLPLQLCDLAGIAAVWALCTYSPAAFALTYFWGLTLTSQAFISPELGAPDFPSLQFLSFFGLHSLVVWTAIYLAWGVGLRPDWSSYRVAVIVTIGWGVVMFVFNQLAGTNYGFLATKPTVASLLDVLGPWPWYLLSELVLGAAAWALLTWPWVRRRIPRATARVTA